MCMEYFPNNHYRVAYTLFHYLGIYLLPVTVMLITYSLIMRRLLHRAPLGEHSWNPHENSKRLRDKKRAVRMLLIILILFALSWLPFFSAQLYFLNHSATLKARTVLALLHLIGYSNSCVNPIVYTFLNESFQAAFLKTLCMRFRAVRSRGRESTVTATDMDRMQMMGSSTHNSTV
jgi:hypothetical protein